MNILQFLENNKIICDGAFGTYFMDREKDLDLPERANLEKTELVKQIHREYIEAGANLIRTNTFAVTPEAFELSEAKLKPYLLQGVKLAKEAARESGREDRIFIAGDIGPMALTGSEEAKSRIQEYYYWEASTLLEAGADLLVFESFPELDILVPVLRRIYDKYEPFILVQFCLNQYGYSSSGCSAAQLFSQAGQMKEISAVGLNCGIGPVHVLNILQHLEHPMGKYISALPNAGYPKLSRDRIVYQQNAEYFADKMVDVSKLGVDFIGGCCGTTPLFIEKIAAKLETDRGMLKVDSAGERDVNPGGALAEKDGRVSTAYEEDKNIDAEKAEHNDNAFFFQKVIAEGNLEENSADTPAKNMGETLVGKTTETSAGQKLLAVELAPPFDTKIRKILEAAKDLKDQNVDIVTFPDSPSGRTRVDSIAMAIKVQQETGLRVMPHICCRDKNTIAMTAQIMGAYINDIRNFLVITGDPVPMASRAVIKSVFSYNSVGMMQILKEMNQNSFAGDEIVFGGAVNCGAVNFDAELMKVRRKMQAGSSFFFTQPIFNLSEMENLRRVKKETGALVLCGLMPLISRKNAEFIKNEITGINVTEEILQQFDVSMSREEAENVGVNICKTIVRDTWDFADGYYFSIPFFRTYLMGRIMEEFR